MPMLTGTLITAVGFLPIGLAQSTVGEYTFAIFAVTAAALVISWLVSVYFVPYLGTVLLEERRKAGSHEQPHELFDTPFYARFRAVVAWCVRHRWKTIGATVASLVLGVAGMGTVQQQFFPDSSRLEVLVDLWYPEGTSFAANEEVTKRVEARILGARRRRGRDHLGRQRRRALRAGARPDLPADQRQPDDRHAARHEGAREAAHRLAGAAGDRVSRGAGARQAAAERPAGAVSGAVPGGRARRRRRSAPMPTRSRRSCAPTRTCAASTTTGTSRSRRCTSTSTRTRRAPSASPARASPRRRASSTAATTSASTATATS